MEFFFPKVAADIDWSKGYEFLDKELQKVVRKADSTRGTVDKLVKLRKSATIFWTYFSFASRRRG
jgi:hypothetical protein